MRLPLRPLTTRLAISLALLGAAALGLTATAGAADLPGEPTPIEGTLAELDIGELYLGAPVSVENLAGKVVLVEYGGL